MFKTSLRRLVPVLVVACAPGAAFAHSGHGDVASFQDGFVHPFTGLDHTLAMVAVGLYAACLGGRALWRVPAAFVGMMAAGAALAASGVGLPGIEAGIALSVVVLGAALACRLSLQATTAMALVGVFALFHGAAHGAEMPAGAGVSYGLGFLAGTAILHVAGLALGLAARTLPDSVLGRVQRVTGAAIGATGLALLAGLV